MDNTTFLTGLDGKRAVVTAGAGGIGLAIARSLAKWGAAVDVCDIDATKLAALSDTPQIHGTRVDVSRAGDVQQFCLDVIDRHGGIDILVNNAGIAGPIASLEDISLDDWRHCLDCNLTSVFLFSKFAIPLMREKGGGVIVNVASTSAYARVPRRTPYVSSKAAVVALTRTLAAEVGQWNIRVNAICPGWVDSGSRFTHLIEAESKKTGQTPEEVLAEIRKQTAMGAILSTEDVADMVTFACSDQARYVSGTSITVDGCEL